MNAKEAKQLTEKAKAEAKMLQTQDGLQIVQTQRTQLHDKIHKAAEDKCLWMHETSEIFAANLKYFRDLGYKIDQTPAFSGALTSLISWDV